jgi:hypothetical protein
VAIGILDYSGDDSIANSASGVMSIGAFPYNGGVYVTNSFQGAIQWMRVSSKARYSGVSVTPPSSVPTSDAATEILFDFTHVVPGASTVHDLSSNQFVGTVASGFSGATAPTFLVAPMFQSATVTNQTVALTWSSIAGSVYQLQYTTNLNPATWNNVGYPLVATNGAITTFDFDAIISGPQRFYRVMLTP